MVLTELFLKRNNEPRNAMIIENGKQKDNINPILNFKYNRQYLFEFLKYFINWEWYPATKKVFNYINNYDQALDRYLAVYLIAANQKQNFLFLYQFLCHLWLGKFHLKSFHFEKSFCHRFEL